ncbi:MAG: DUF2460 domain-containing protein [Cypionkella sp.]
MAGTVLVTSTVPAGPELLLSWDNPQDGTNWTTYGSGSVDASTFGSFTHAFQVGNLTHRSSIFHPPAIVPGTSYRVSYWLKEGTSTQASLKFRARPTDNVSQIKGPYAAPAIALQAAGSVSNVQATNLGGTNWLWSFDVIPLAGNTSVFIEIGNGSTGTVIVYGASLKTPAIDGPASGWTLDTTTGLITFGVAPVAGGVLTAGFEFDTPVRFDTDMLDVALKFERLGSIQSIPLIEVRK